MYIYVLAFQSCIETTKQIIFLTGRRPEVKTFVAATAELHRLLNFIV